MFSFFFTRRPSQKQKNMQIAGFSKKKKGNRKSTKKIFPAIDLAFFQQKTEDIPWVPGVWPLAATAILHAPVGVNPPPEADFFWGDLCQFIEVGGWKTLTFPTEWKVKKFMFQNHQPVYM